jgi:hypothetical protein
VRRIGEQRLAERTSLLKLHAARVVDQRQFFGFLLRVGGQFLALERDLMLVHLAL